MLKEGETGKNLYGMYEGAVGAEAAETRAGKLVRGFGRSSPRQKHSEMRIKKKVQKPFVIQRTISQYKRA